MQLPVSRRHWHPKSVFSLQGVNSDALYLMVMDEEDAQGAHQGRYNGTASDALLQRSSVTRPPGVQLSDVYITARPFKNWGGAAFQNLPDPVKESIIDMGVCHFMVLMKDPDGSITQWDYGPCGGDLHLGMLPAAQQPCQLRSHALQASMSDTAQLRHAGGGWQNQRGSKDASFAATAQELQVHEGTLGEIREHLLAQLPSCPNMPIVYVGSTTRTHQQIREFNWGQPKHYLLHKNDCRHYVNSLVHYMTGLEKGTSHFVREQYRQKVVSQGPSKHPHRPLVEAAQVITDVSNWDTVKRVGRTTLASLCAVWLWAGLKLVPPSIGFQAPRMVQRLEMSAMRLAVTGVRQHSERAAPALAAAAVTATSKGAAAMQVLPLVPKQQLWEIEQGSADAADMQHVKLLGSSLSSPSLSTAPATGLLHTAPSCLAVEQPSQQLQYSYARASKTALHAIGSGWLRSFQALLPAGRQGEPAVGQPIEPVQLQDQQPEYDQQNLRKVQRCQCSPMWARPTDVARMKQGAYAQIQLSDAMACQPCTGSRLGSVQHAVDNAGMLGGAASRVVSRLGGAGQSAFANAVNRIRDVRAATAIAVRGVDGGASARHRPLDLGQQMVVVPAPDSLAAAPEYDLRRTGRRAAQRQLRGQDIQGCASGSAPLAAVHRRDGAGEAGACQHQVKARFMTGGANTSRPWLSNIHGSGISDERNKLGKAAQQHLLTTASCIFTMAMKQQHQVLGFRFGW